MGDPAGQPADRLHLLRLRQLLLGLADPGRKRLDPLVPLCGPGAHQSVEARFQPPADLLPLFRGKVHPADDFRDSGSERGQLTGPGAQPASRLFRFSISTKVVRFRPSRVAARFLFPPERWSAWRMRAFSKSSVALLMSRPVSPSTGIAFSRNRSAR